MNGYIIVDAESGYFYNGLNQFKKDIRDAKIYHTEKGARGTMEYKFPDREVILRGIEISII